MRTKTLRAHSGQITCCLQLKDRRLVSASKDKSLRIWDLGHAKSAPLSLKGHSNHVTCCIQLQDEQLISGSADGKLKIWDIHTGKCVATLSGHKEPIVCIVQLHDYRVLSASSNMMKFWDLSLPSECRLTLTSGANNIRSCLQLRDQTILSAGLHTLKLWEPSTTGDFKFSLTGHTHMILCCIQLQDNRIVSGSMDNTLKVWGLESSECKQTLKGHTGGVVVCLELKDGRILSGSLDCTLMIWDLLSGKSHITLSGHTKHITSCLQLFDERIISSSADHFLRIWDCHSGECLNILSLHSHQVKCCLELHDHRILSGGHDNQLIIWDENDTLESTDEASQDATDIPKGAPLKHPQEDDYFPPHPKLRTRSETTSDLLSKKFSSWLKPPSFLSALSFPRKSKKMIKRRNTISSINATGLGFQDDDEEEGEKYTKGKIHPHPYTNNMRGKSKFMSSRHFPSSSGLQGFPSSPSSPQISGARTPKRKPSPPQPLPPLPIDIPTTETPSSQQKSINQPNENDPEDTTINVPMTPPIPRETTSISSINSSNSMDSTVADPLHYSSQSASSPPPSKPPSAPTDSHVSQFLQELGLSEYQALFDQERMSMDNLLDITMEELKDMNIPLGPRKTILKRTNELNPKPANRTSTRVRSFSTETSQKLVSGTPPPMKVPAQRQLPPQQQPTQQLPPPQLPPQQQPPISRKSKPMSSQFGFSGRVMDLAEEPLQYLSPICGIARQKLLPLESAIVPLKDLVPDIEKYVWLAQKAVQQQEQLEKQESQDDETSDATNKSTTTHKVLPDNLTRDEKASIRLYSMEWNPSENSVYFVLNQMLRSEDRENILPFFPYLKLLLTALSKLPDTGMRTIYRGVKGDLSSKYKCGTSVMWWGFSSCTLKLSVLKNPSFLGSEGPRTLFSVTTTKAKKILKYSLFQAEEEVLLPPAQSLLVDSVLDLGNGLTMIQLKEENTPFPLIE